MASGDTLIVFHPLSAELDPSNFPTLDVRGGQHTVLDFDDTTNETCYFKAIMPQSYAGTTGVTVYLHWAMSTGTSNSVDWDVAFERVSDSIQDIDSTGFAAVNSADNQTVPGTAGLVEVSSIAFTDGADMDSVVAGDGFRISVTRDATNDNGIGDAELWCVEIRET